MVMVSPMRAASPNSLANRRMEPAGTVLISGDPESYFVAEVTGITITQA